MAFSPRNHEPAADFCRALAERIDWSPIILERWPTPLAFEYWRLREELARGQMLAAMVQLKDCTEVLVKLVVSIAGRLLIEHGGPRQQHDARWFLLNRKPPPLGDWVNEGVKLIEQAYQLNKDDWRPWASVLGLLSKSGRKPQPTALWQKLEKLVAWRNRELGHGALRLDMLDLTKDLDKRMTAFNAGLARHEAAWDGITLAVSLDPDRTLAFTGHAALEAAQPALLESVGNHALAPLRLDRDGHTLWLGPYVCLRRHSRDAEVGCYVLNKRIGKRSQALLNLLDYRTGDTATVGRADAEPSLVMELDSLPEEANANGGEDAPVGDLGDDEVRDFLDGISFQREYVAPDYLRHAVRVFLDPTVRDRGLFWLCGPADVGKTLFAYGLATHGAISKVLGKKHQPAPLWDDLETIVVTIRREYRYTVPALSSDVLVALKRSASDKFLDLGFCLKGEPDRPGAFCAWLGRIRDEATRYNPSARFLLVLDGLDELPPLDETVEGGSMVDLLPPADRLPERVFLLLTSRGRDPARPADDCPMAVYTALERAVAASTDALRARYALDPQTNADYRAVLRTFFEQRLTALYPQETERAALFERVLEHGEHRFKALSYFTALLASGAIGPADLAELSAEPLQQHLAALETWEPPRKFALVRRILLELAAAEQAHRAEIALMEPAPVIERQWLGLDLLELARRVGHPATRPRELDPRFLTALYSVRELIRSYRGGAATTSRFALGLKGMVEQLEVLDGWSTAETLLRLANEALGDYQAANDATAETTTLIRAGGSVAALVAGGLRLSCWDAVKDVYWACIDRAETYREQARTVEALRLAITAQALAELAAHPDEPEERRTELKNHAAGTKMTRGNVRQARGELDIALSDYDAAIKLREALRAELEPAGRWEVGLRNDLATAYMNRGNAKLDASGHGPGAALSDYDAAIKLMEALRAELEPAGRWEVGLRNDLAKAYSNRGLAKQDASGHGPGAALSDYDAAIKLMDALRAELEPAGRWEVGLRNALANAYMNCGNAKQDASGHGPGAALNDYDAAIKLMEALRAELEPAGRWEVGLRNALAAAYMNRGTAKLDASGHGPGAALNDYDAAIKLREALRAELEPAGRWEVGLR
ncbi:MAG: hypothetical protein P9F19_12275, partial [Candidatus Contendobacter sp.]|nr:hypothetical protein [Candidatus Contendobacter sp.]